MIEFKCGFCNRIKSEVYQTTKEGKVVWRERGVCKPCRDLENEHWAATRTKGSQHMLYDKNGKEYQHY